MTATASSKVNRIIGVATIIGSININLLDATWFPRRVIKRCPAIIFAARRIARVTGRIRFLVVSIRTMNGIRAGGVLWGIKCASI